jgi:hypothetical protein
MQQPFQKVDLVLPAHRENSGLPSLWMRSSDRMIRYRITRRAVFQYGSVSFFGHWHGWKPPAAAQLPGGSRPAWRQFASGGIRVAAEAALAG